MPVLSSTDVQTTTLGGTVTRSLINGLTGQAGSTRMNFGMMHHNSIGNPGLLPGSVNFPAAETDWRVRVSLAPNSDYFTQGGSSALLSPLDRSYEKGPNNIGNTLANAASKLIKGAPAAAGSPKLTVIFPYTPTITITHTAKYEPQRLTHNNYTQYFYDSSDVGAITVTANFTVQNVREGQYLLATIHFFRTITKMFFGLDAKAGNPPPIVYLNGYGQYYLPNIPCVATSFSHTMPNDVDYLDIPEPGITEGAGGYSPTTNSYRSNSTRMPTNSQLAITLQPVYSRLAQSQGFSLESFSQGALINRVGAAGAAWSGGASAGVGTINNSKNGGFI